VVGYLNQIQMGAVTGLGVIGRNAAPHSHHGARLMLGGVVTLPTWGPGVTGDRRAGLSLRVPRLCRRLSVQALLGEKKRVRHHDLSGLHGPHAPHVQALVRILSKLKARGCGEHMSLRAFDEHTFTSAQVCGLVSLRQLLTTHRPVHLQAPRRPPPLPPPGLLERPRLEQPSGA